LDDSDQELGSLDQSHGSSGLPSMYQSGNKEKMDGHNVPIGTSVIVKEKQEVGGSDKEIKTLKNVEVQQKHLPDSALQTKNGVQQISPKIAHRKVERTKRVTGSREGSPMSHRSPEVHKKKQPGHSAMVSPSDSAKLRSDRSPEDLAVVEAKSFTPDSPKERLAKSFHLFALVCMENMCVCISYFSICKQHKCPIFCHISSVNGWSKVGLKALILNTNLQVNSEKNTFFLSHWIAF